MTLDEDRLLLGRLAAAYGVSTEYFDIWGTQHAVSAESLRAVLRAMGVAVETREQLAASLASLHARYWRRLCDPVTVVGARGRQDEWRLRVRSESAQDAGWTIHWTLTDEADGIVRQGTEAAPLEVVEVTSVEQDRHIALRLPIPLDLPHGYYTLAVTVRNGAQQSDATSSLIVVPETCYVPPCLLDSGKDERRSPSASSPATDSNGTWGLWTQLYSLRSRRNWGIGDFTDLAEVTRWVGEHLGGGAVGVNPLHALKNARPYSISPYSPDSRSALNEIYLDPVRVPEFDRCAAARALVESDAFRARLDDLHKSALVDYEGVAQAKSEVMELLYRQLVEEGTAATEPARDGGKQSPAAATARARLHAFRRYCEEQGAWLEDYATYRALNELYGGERTAPRLWPTWPEEYRHPKAAGIAAFRAAHRARIDFFQYVQWQAEAQLDAVVRLTRELRMSIGLYHDFALGSDPNGAEGWRLQDVLARDVDCGCPPDAFALQGQNWGFPPLQPVALREAAYRPFIALLRQNLRRGGALRLDHVMGLFRLFWIPKGQSPALGTYVEYPFADLLGILALESQRAQTLVIGEDLGTVPEWIREQLARVQAFSYRVWYFERRGDGSWNAPSDYPDHSLAVATTHDLPTLLGFWLREDLRVREQLGLFPDEAVRARTWAERDQDQQRMREALRMYGDWRDGGAAEGAHAPGAIGDHSASATIPPGLVEAVHRFLARTSSRVVLASLDDWVGERAQVNVPGTVDEYPNWLRKTALPLEEMVRDPQCRRLAAMMVAARGRGSQPPQPLSGGVSPPASTTTSE